MIIAIPERELHSYILGMRRPRTTPIHRQTDPNLPRNECEHTRAPRTQSRPPFSTEPDPRPCTQVTRHGPRHPHPTLTSRSPSAQRRAAADRTYSREARAAVTAAMQPEQARHPATLRSATRSTATTRPAPQATATTPNLPRPTCLMAPTHPTHQPTRKRRRPPDPCRYPPRHQDARPRRPRRDPRRNRRRTHR